MLRFQPDDCKTLISDDVPMTYRRPPDDVSDDVLYPFRVYPGPAGARPEYLKGQFP
jgi:hypothetical protein